MIKFAKRSISALIVILLIVSPVPGALAREPLSEQVVYERIMAMQSQYPEGMRWTNADIYEWPPDVWRPANASPNTRYTMSGGGCVAFAMILSDAAFGRDTRVEEHHDLSRMRVGDIVRTNDGTYREHSFVILNIDAAHVTIAEGNYNSSIHWGRKITHEWIRSNFSYIWTRYPAGFAEPMPLPEEIPPGAVINSTSAFVARLYNVCLGRDPDPAGYAAWTSRLDNGEYTGSSAAHGFIFSREMADKRLSNSDFTEILYNALLGRQSDANGKAHWVNTLASGVSRENVFNQFAVSAEFAGLCAEYGIRP